MSWKGFSKSVTRAPQQVRARFNMGEITKDDIYIDAERRFADLEKETKKLHDESKKYFEAINGMLDHQIEFSKACAQVYQPISGRMSDPDSYVVDGNPEGIRACEEYEALVHELKASLAPELEMIEQRIVKPADELTEIIKAVRKTAVKRDHKQLDYDRHRGTLKKIEDKKEKTLKDEKALYKAENNVDGATEEYEYFNNLLKEELPQLFKLEREFIQPLFQSFYYMQLNVFYTLHEKMQGIDIGYFNLQLDIESGFEEKRGDIQQQIESIPMVKFKTKGAAKRPLSKYRQNQLAIENGKAGGSGHAQIAYEPHQEEDEEEDEAPPAYGHTPVSAVTPVTPWSAAAKGKAAPPPPKPKPGFLGGSHLTVTAIYDYDAQAQGDLSFKAGDHIEVIHKGGENEWWTGKLRGVQGQFPGKLTHDRPESILTIIGNYVQQN
ncbi:hypothetical protein AMS68_000395 [Peltaster fructicola]|uniref:BAR domain-containing protein n=1 Tax=Peltaster fructicola TaxID=286661 RepID=A0A6H0XJR6_9PEZI|nr:hypothetical protein AMS68_000395 [Peltaster fructicola]